MFYPGPAVICVLVFLPSALLFYKETSISLSDITKPSLKTISLILLGFLFSFKLKIIPNHRPRCVSIRFLERIDSYPIRLVSLSESERSNPSPLWKSCRKNWFQWKQKTYPSWKLERGNSDPVGWKHTYKSSYSSFHNMLINCLHKRANAEAAAYSCCLG